jgi:type I restriction enzyme, S subunit
MNRPAQLGWRKTTLGELFRLKHGFAFKSRFFAPAGNPLVLTPGNFEADGGIKHRGDRDRYYSTDFPREYLLQPDDLLVVMTDLTQECRILGSPGFVPSGGSYLHNQRLGKVEQLRSDILAVRYLYYLFNTTEVRSRLRDGATGTTVRHTSPDRIYAVCAGRPARSRRCKSVAMKE